jgi:hypothetical protein
MPDYILQQLGLHDPSLLSTQSSPVKLRNVFECDIVKRPVERPSSRDLLNQFPVDEEHSNGICTQKIECFNSLSQVFADRHLSNHNDAQKKTRLPCLPAEIPIKRESKVQTRRDLDHSDKIKDVQNETANYSGKRCERLTRKELFKQFAQRMNENAIQFEMFCAMNTAVAQQAGQTKQRQ